MIESGLHWDLAAECGDPSMRVTKLEQIGFVMKRGGGIDRSSSEITVCRKSMPTQSVRRSVLKLGNFIHLVQLKDLIRFLMTFRRKDSSTTSRKPSGRLVTEGPEKTPKKWSPVASNLRRRLSCDRQRTVFIAPSVICEKSAPKCHLHSADLCQ